MKRSREDINIHPLHTSYEKKMCIEKFPELPSTVLRGIVVGTSGGGKTVMLQNLICRRDLYGGIFEQKNIIILSPTLTVNDAFKDLAKANKFNDSNKFIQIIDTLLDHVAIKTREIGAKNIPPMLVIIDDCSCSKKLWSYGGPVDKLFTIGRNYNISTIVVAHRLNLLSRNVKLNINFAILFPVVNQTELESFVIQFAPRNYRQLVTAALTEVFKTPHQFIFINKQLPFEEQLRVGIKDNFIEYAKALHPELDPERVDQNIVVNRAKRQASERVSDSDSSSELIKKRRKNDHK